VDVKINIRKRNGAAVMGVKGEIDIYTAPKLREQLLDLADKGERNIVVDLQGVEFLDSTGLGVLVAGLKRMKSSEGDLSLVCTSEKILKVFRITGLMKVFRISETVEAAIAASSNQTRGA
jgi:anti-sigma B factor antagonist